MRILQIFKSFWFLPSLLGLVGLLLAGATVWVDRTFSAVVPIFNRLRPVTTRAVLETIATASITVISLTYSITLVVFTLAAGNIGPRLLTRFRESIFTRLSIGVFCCTFLFAITVLNFVGDNNTPRLSALIAFILSIVSVYVLIVYVHHVSSQVLVDNEVAASAGRAQAAIEDMLSHDNGTRDEDTQRVPDRAPEWTVRARQTGYVRRVDTETLIDAASENGCFIRVNVAPGDFVIKGIPIASVKGDTDQEIAETIVCDGILVGESRMPDNDLSFLIHLIVEIAIRALSPGINDSYTAISCVDNLSATLSQLLQSKAPPPIYLDADGEPRLYFEAIDITDVLEKTLRPLRINARGNLIVTLRLLQALQNMIYLSLPQYRQALLMHAELIMIDAEKSISNEKDLEDVSLGYKAIVRQLKESSMDQSNNNHGRQAQE